MEAEAPVSDERLGQLFIRHQDRLFRLAWRMLADREEARDAVQETYLRAARSGEALPEASSGAEAWLVRTLVNYCRDLHRRRLIRRAFELFRPVPPPPTNPEADAVSRSLVLSALVKLPARQRAIVVLHDLEDHPISTISELLKLKAATVRWHLAAARKSLSKRFASLPELPPERQVESWHDPNCQTATGSEST